MGVFEILLVEDNPDHATLCKHALKGENFTNPVHWVKDGQAAVDYLFKKGAYSDVKSPGLVLLDIKLPKLSGHEVLKKIKTDEHLRVIPVIMLTTSDQEEDVQKSYLFGANGFITKPVKFTELSEKIKSFKKYWLLTNQGPKIR